MCRVCIILISILATLGLSPAAGQSASPPSLPSDSTPADSASTAEHNPVGGLDSNGVWTTVADHSDDYIGAHDRRTSPYRHETEANRTAPPLRYNRVEGLVLGLQRDPLQPDDEEHTRAFGQLAYAVGLNDLRYTVGVESRLYAADPTSLTLGVQYHDQTVSPDRWKTSYAEASLASIGFGDELFDYYEAEGLSVYATQTLPHTVQVTAGVRAETHRSLTQHTGWSVFGSSSFRANPPIDDGDLQALFAELTAGTVSDPEGLPTGAAARLAATVADGIGGHFSFYRYEADARGFLPLTSDTRLGLRLRGGYTTSRTPTQSQFSLGGVGSMRGYGQNQFRGTRMLLANAEYLVDGATVFDDVLDDLFVGGLFDAGWTGTPDDAFRGNDIFSSAGFSVGLDERKVRLDVVWPLRDLHSNSAPSIRLRIAPSF